MAHVTETARHLPRNKRSKKMRHEINQRNIVLHWFPNAPARACHFHRLSMRSPSHGARLQQLRDVISWSIRILPVKSIDLLGKTRGQSQTWQIESDSDPFWNKTRTEYDLVGSNLSRTQVQIIFAEHYSTIDYHPLMSGIIRCRPGSTEPSFIPILATFNREVQC